MATPTLGLTFQDIVIRVAEYLGVASYASSSAAIPTDTHDLDMVKRIANDGYARFINEHHWNFRNGEVVITPDGVAYAFDLPDDFQGELLTEFTYPTDGPISFVRETSEEHIRHLRTGGESFGHARLFAIRPKDGVDETTSAARWEVIFWPTPVDDTALTARYRRYPDKLTNNTDRSIAGPEHDQTVKQAAVAAAEIQRYGEMGPQEKLYQVYLASSMRADARHAPRNLGYNGDGSDKEGIPRWPDNTVDTYNGNPV